MQTYQNCVEYLISTFQPSQKSREDFNSTFQPSQNCSKDVNSTFQPYLKKRRFEFYTPDI